MVDSGFAGSICNCLLKKIELICQESGYKFPVRLDKYSMYRDFSMMTGLIDLNLNFM